MEVRTDVLRVENDGGERETYLGSCYTMMAARDTETFGKAQVPQLVGGDELLAHEVAEGRRRHAKRRALVANALDKTPPDAVEVPLLHELWRTRGGGGCGDAEEAAAHRSSRVPMARTLQSAVDIMQPSKRNQNGYIFGGYLMRRALELAWLSAFRFCKAPPTFAGLDDVVFSRPVKVGKLLEYVGRVVYVAPDGSLRVFVEAHHLSLRSGAQEPTANFHFVFRPQADPDEGEGHALGQQQVQPDSYEEGLLWLEGRRRWLNSGGFKVSKCEEKDWARDAAAK